jgi:hypothetical protein
MTTKHKNYTFAIYEISQKKKKAYTMYARLLFMMLPQVHRNK